MFVIRRCSDDKYVARPGLAHSYTTTFDYAARYATYEEARRNCCGNEYVHKI